MIYAGLDAGGTFAAGEEDAPVADRARTICLDSGGCGEVAGQVEWVVVALEPAVAAEPVKVAGSLVLVAAGSGAAVHFEPTGSGWIAADVAGQEDEGAAGYEVDWSSSNAGQTGSDVAAAARKLDTAGPFVLAES